MAVIADDDLDRVLDYLDRVPLTGGEAVDFARLQHRLYDALQDTPVAEIFGVGVRSEDDQGSEDDEHGQ